MRVRKAVIPAAGYGTRFLPISKSIPKEMVPVVDKPVIQYVVEEAVESGITDILIVISRSKRAIEEHFFPTYELEQELQEKGKRAALAAVRGASDLSQRARIQFVWQHRMGGLGDAILYAREHSAGEPVAVLMGDTIVEPMPGERPVTRQLCDVVEARGGTAIALEEVPEDRVSRYGIVEGTVAAERLIAASRLVEKPKPGQTTSRMAVTSRYVLAPEVFDHLAAMKPHVTGELQLTDALQAMASSGAVWGWLYGGHRHDIGDRLGFIETNVLFGLRDPGLRPKLLEFLASQMSEANRGA